jgi:serine protease inhibitor
MSVEQINKYVYEQTNGKIDNVITLLPPDVSLVLANKFTLKEHGLMNLVKRINKKKIFK